MAILGTLALNAWREYQAQSGGADGTAQTGGAAGRRDRHGAVGRHGGRQRGHGPTRRGPARRGAAHDFPSRPGSSRRRTRSRR